MRIACLEISGFRGIKSAALVLPEHGALLGANNVGKTAVTEALALLFGRERVSYQLSDWDFFGGQPKPDTRFSIVCTITGFSSNEPDQEPDWFCGEAAAHPVWWREDEGRITFETDCPSGGKLAAQIALAARYNEEDCEIETLRYFYHGQCDPFADGCHPVNQRRLQDLGVFILPGNRQWDKLLSFGSSSFLKALRQADAVPGIFVEKLKAELRMPKTAIEDAPNLQPLLASAERELRLFTMLQAGGALAYRPTSLDTFGVLQSLLPHIKSASGELLPLSRHGAGMVSLQSFLIILAFAEQRRNAGKNFILIAEEPELHLHPSLHKRLANRIRAVSSQSIITTHSPLVAASYSPTQTLFLQNVQGKLGAVRLAAGSPKTIKPNSIRKLYLQKREAFYGAILGPGILVPEGEFDYEWLRILQQLAECTEDKGGALLNVAAISIVPTQDSVVETYFEVARLRPDAIPFVDGDSDGDKYLASLSKFTVLPRTTIQMGLGAAIECLAAWVLEPALANPGDRLRELLPNAGMRDLKSLQHSLCDGTNKKARELHETLVWEALDTPECGIRAAEFFNDIARIVNGDAPTSQGWQQRAYPNGLTTWVASHIQKK
jgi:hypothetical protein